MAMLVSCNPMANPYLLSGIIEVTTGSFPYERFS